MSKQSGTSGESDELRRTIKDLEKELDAQRAQGRDFDILKKQAGQQSKEYGRLADEHNKLVSSAMCRKEMGTRLTGVVWQRVGQEGGLGMALGLKRSLAVFGSVMSERRAVPPHSS